MQDMAVMYVDTTMCSDVINGAAAWFSSWSCIVGEW